MSTGSILGKLIRLPLKLIPKSAVIPILQGKLKGKKWIAGSLMHGCWLGNYEYEKRIIFEKLISPGSIVFDIGANVGFYTLVASYLVGKEGKIYAFEPLKRNIAYLKKHLQLNKITNVEIFEVAVTNFTGTANFAETESPAEGHLDKNGNIIVPTTSLEEIVRKQNLPYPKFIKIDIEGAELNALKGAKEILIKEHPTIFLSTHGKEIHTKCCEFLKSLNYKLEPINKKEPIEESSDIIAYY